MKRTIPFLIIAVLSFSLVLSSCDAVVSVTGAMGRNVGGFNRDLADYILLSHRVEDDPDSEILENYSVGECTLTYARRFYYVTEDAVRKEFITVGTDSASNSVVSWGDWVIEIESGTRFSSITGIILPHDLTLTQTLLESSAEDYASSFLSRKVDDERTLEAAKGSLTLLSSLLKFSDTVCLSVSGSKRAKAFLSMERTLVGNIEEKGDAITWGDVVTLEVITNLLSQFPSSLSSFITLMATEGASGNMKSAFNALLEEMNDFLYSSIELLNDVSPSTSVFSGISITDIMAAAFMK